MTDLPESVQIPPSEEELEARLAQVRVCMTQEELDYYVVFDPVNVYYLTNFANEVHERPFILVIALTGPPRILVPLLELTHVQARARRELAYVTYDEFPAPEGQNWFDRYGEMIPPQAHVGIEPTLPVAIADRTPGTPFITDILEATRLVKSRYEIGRCVHACRIINLGHTKLLEVCHPGVLEIAIQNETKRVMMARLLMDIPSANLVVTHVRGVVWPPALSHDPHIIPPALTPMVEGGPHVSAVYGQVDGYGVELERTFFLGYVPEAAQEPFQVMMDARARAFELCRPGMPMGEIDRAVKKCIAEADYGGRLLHRTGHGLGITGHEAPYLAEGYDRELQPGMLISIEPGIYIPGVGGFRHSDSVLVTDSGCVSLTEAPESLADLTIPV